MGRKRQAPEANGHATAVAEPPANEQHNGTHAGEPAEAKKKPAASFRARSDRTTSIETSVWATEMEKGGETWTQYSVSVKRCYKTEDGWHEGGSFRIHDIPVLSYLLDRAYQFCVGARTEVKLDDSIPL